MRYALLLHYPEPAEGELDAERMEEGMRAFDAYAKALAAAGVLGGADVLHPSTATTTVTAVSGAPTVQSGPFADGPERLGGVITIEVDDLDAAIEWAARAPSAAWGHVEVRPVATRFVDGEWR
ncbi:YciI family protein [Microbacterium sp. No. 7]|uniref:YciI family protein n=1 Tax=Microbacterium sp. No. 7 TaxID=1714373 RepID=UPI0006CFCCFE|nr:YciI family protein [Microbacterium sp. No. 7]ALJ18458.1 hypothetical protein AOA12_00410 [Microbacterium sp. No. 7]